MAVKQPGSYPGKEGVTPETVRTVDVAANVGREAAGDADIIGPKDVSHGSVCVVSMIVIHVYLPLAPRD